MSKINAAIVPIKQVLGLDLKIPNYQRPYRWEEKNVALLLEDIYASWKNVKSAYRIGSIILHKEKDDNETLSIVDGQQRLTTIVLIINQLQSELVTKHINKLKYKHSDSVSHLKKNNEFIKHWIDEYISDKKTEFVKYLTTFCQFVKIEVDNLSEAFQMFDSQNSRGKSLEPYNLLKAYHIRAMEDDSEQEKIECDRRWENATRYVANPLSQQNSKDILKQIFNEQLYRSRLWSRKEYAYTFDNKKIDEFKGVTISHNKEIAHPYLNSSMLNYVALKYFDSLQVQVKGMKDRFHLKNLSNVSPFTLVNQPIINGKLFFDYIETYVEIYKQIFIHTDDKICLEEFKKFYDKQCKYPKSYRVGDQYLRELYKSLIVMVFDKFGESGVNTYYKDLYTIVYRLRLEKKQVRYASVAKYPVDNQLFSIIENAKNNFDLRHLSIMAKEKVHLNKNEDVIENFMEEHNIELIRH